MIGKEHIKVLLIEDNPDDVFLIEKMLSEEKNVYLEIAHSDRLSSALKLLADESFDVIVSDLGLPDSQGIETFLSIHAAYPDVPVIMLTGLNDEGLAIKAVQSGAQDYLVKDQVNRNLLVRSMRYSIGRRKMITQLEKSLKEIKTLQGLIPICAWCKNVRDDKGYWKKVENYIEEHSDVAFTHGICPGCMEKIDPEFRQRALSGNLLRGKDENEDADDQSQGARINILLIEDDPVDAAYVQEILSGRSFLELQHASRLSSAIDELANGKFNVILCDLGLPDSQGIETLIRLHTVIPDVPIIVLTGLNDEELAVTSVRSGAQDYLVKGQDDARSFLKSIRYSIERHKLTASMGNKLKEIGKLERERNNILSMFAHDLKNAILPSIVFLTRTLSGKTQNLKADLEPVKDGLVMAEHMLTKFIEFSRLETKGYKPVYGLFDLEDAVKRQVENSRIMADEKGILMTYESPEKSVPGLTADAIMISRVISNLIDNAIKYTGTGGQIKVRVLTMDKNVVVQVEDNGPGIHEEHMPFIFDAFYRASSDRRGSGLGLSIARTIIEAHKGQIWVQSELGRGSTFSFSLAR